MSPRLEGVAQSLARVAPGRFAASPRRVSPRNGESAVEFVPVRDQAASLRLTDTGVSVYIEVLGARWELDTADDVSVDEARLPDFAVQLPFAIDVARCVALHGLVRVRREWRVFGAETYLLRGEDDLGRWENDSAFRIVRRWSPW